MVRYRSIFQKYSEAPYNPHLFQRQYNILVTMLLTVCNTTWRLVSWLDKRANTAHHTQPVWCALEKLPTLFAVLVVLGKTSVVKWHVAVGPRTHSYYCHNASVTIYWFLRELPCFAHVCNGHFSSFPSLCVIVHWAEGGDEMLYTIWIK